MEGKTNKGLVEYVKAQLGLPYWYATYGNIATEKLYNVKKKNYPKYYTATDFSTQYGYRVHDCSGLIKAYLFCETPTSKPKYNKEYDRSALGTIRACSEQGDISTMPETVGLILWKTGHVGVYIGNGEVVEAKGHKYGVILSKLSNGNWLKWGKLDDITYEEDIKMTNVSLPVCYKGLKNLEAICTIQRLLNALGITDENGNSLDVDGSFGKRTDYAVRAFQSSRGLEVDGRVGNKTWKSLIG